MMSRLFAAFALACAFAAPAPATERCRASWYGAAHDGLPTASGEPFDPDAATCAHKSVPLGTWVRVTRRDTGASALCRVNDRGPFVSGRCIDVSRAIAEALGMVGAGVVPVTVEVTP